MLLSTGERDLVRAVRDGDQRPRPPRDLADRLAGRDRHRHRRTPRRGSSRCAPTASASALDEDQHRPRRRLPGRLDRQDVTTLGRGGSDTTAVALAAAVGAEVCEIYTDVARRLQRRPADRARRPQAARRLVRGDARDGGLAAPACCSCAASSTRATTACASTAGRASTTRPGTFVVAEQETMEHPLITAVTHSTGEARVTLHRRPRHARRRRPRRRPRSPRRTSTST